MSCDSFASKGALCIMSFTNSASNEIIKNLESKRNSGENVLGIKILLRKAGCMGNKYFIEYVYNAPDASETISVECSSNGKSANVFLSKYDLVGIIGTEVDYETNDLKSGFIFRNPNVKSRCGCGDSFSI